MSIIESFDDFNSTEQIMPTKDQRPFQFREYKDKQGTLDWLNQNFDAKIERAQSRFIVYRRYQAYFKNVHWRHFDARDSHRDIEYTQRKPRHSVNFVYDKMEDRVAQMDRMNVNVTVIPANQDEQKDINNAKAAKQLLTGKAKEFEMQSIQNQADYVKFLFGHSFIFNEWNPEKGPLHPKYERYKKAGVKIPKFDSSGKRKKGKFITEDIHIGDMDIEVLGPDRVFPEIGKKRWDDVNELDKIDYVNKWELKARYPNKADDINETQPTKYFQFNMDDISLDSDMVMVKTFYHKKTKFLPQGAMIKYTDDVILEWNDYPYDEDCLPCIPDTDIDIHEELWGRSFIQNIEQMQRYYNNIQSAQARNEGIGSAPKWMMPKGSAKVSALNNEFTIVEYQGAVAPQLITPRASNPQSFELQDRLENKIGRMARTSDISRGEPPKGVTANSALRFLEEQESRMIAPMEKKRKARIRKTYKMMLRRIQQFYKKDQDRVVRILGESNDYLIKSFDSADFNTIYDISIENTSALADTKSGKISDIIDLNMSTQTDPIFRREHIVQMLDLGLDRDFVDGATVAVTAAKTMIEEMLNGGSVPEPQETDNFLVYYSLLDKTMQSFSFRAKVDDITRETFKVYTTVLEGMMWNRAKKNAKFAQELSMLDNYPMFFTPEQPLTAILQMHMGAIQPPQQPTGQGGADTSKIKQLDKKDDKGDK